MDVKLVMFKSNGQRKDFPLQRDVTVIGRGEKCDLQIPLVSVSRRHCELLLDAESLKVKDLASSNGTYVNNKRVNETSLKAGDRLVVGPIVFTVQIDGQPEEIHPVKTRGQKLAESGQGQEDSGLASDADVFVLPESDEEDVDPIAALEALAGGQDEDDK